MFSIRRKKENTKANEKPSQPHRKVSEFDESTYLALGAAFGRLPGDLIQVIYSLLKRRRDKTRFALVCKTFATRHALVELKKSEQRQQLRSILTFDPEMLDKRLITAIEVFVKTVNENYKNDANDKETFFIALSKLIFQLENYLAKKMEKIEKKSSKDDLLKNAPIAISHAKAIADVTALLLEVITPIFEKKDRAEQIKLTMYVRNHENLCTKKTIISNRFFKIRIKSPFANAVKDFSDLMLDLTNNHFNPKTPNQR